MSAGLYKTAVILLFSLGGGIILAKGIAAARERMWRLAALYGLGALMYGLLVLWTALLPC